MAYFHQDPDNGLHIRVDRLAADETAVTLQKITALDNQLSDNINNQWIPAKATATAAAITAQDKIDAAVAEGNADDEATWREELALQNGQIASANSNITRDTLLRNHCGLLASYITELTNHRAE